MIVRDFRLSDISDLYRLASLSLDEEYAPEIFNYFHMQWPAGQLVVCLPDGRVVGFISSTRTDGDARIMLFAVDPMYQGRGAGSRLLDALRMRARMNGIHTLTLEVRNNNIRAISFYRHRGFMTSGVLERFYNDGGSAVRMTGYV